MKRFYTTTALVLLVTASPALAIPDRAQAPSALPAVSAELRATRDALRARLDAMGRDRTGIEEQPRLAQWNNWSDVWDDWNNWRNW